MVNLYWEICNAISHHNLARFEMPDFKDREEAQEHFLFACLWTVVIGIDTLYQNLPLQIAKVKHIHRPTFLSSGEEMHGKGFG